LALTLNCSRKKTAPLAPFYAFLPATKFAIPAYNILETGRLCFIKSMKDNGLEKDCEFWNKSLTEYLIDVY